MKTIVEINPLEKGVAEVRFGDGTSLQLARDLVARFKLKVSGEIDEERLDRIIEESEGGGCYEAALRYIEFRPRSENELKRHLLAKRAYSSAAVDRAIQRLKSNKLLDDRSFADAWVSDRIKFKPKSRFMIQRELAQKGLGAEDIAGATDDIDDSASAYQAGLKKARLLRSAGRLEFSRRLSAYLGRRGYSGDVVRSVVTRLWQEIEQK